MHITIISLIQDCNENEATFLEAINNISTNPGLEIKDINIISRNIHHYTGRDDLIAIIKYDEKPEELLGNREI